MLVDQSQNHTLSSGTCGDLYSRRDVDFLYRQIGDRLFHEIHELIKLGEPVAMLGPLASGKQTFLARLGETEREARAIAVMLRCESYSEKNCDQFPLDIAHEIVKQQRETVITEQTTQRWDQEIETILRGEETRITLLFSNIDALPTQTAKLVLKSLRRLKNLGGQSIGTLSVVFTGSYDLAPLVYGIESEFPISRQFVLQGFDQASFNHFLHTYVQSFGFTITSLGCDRLFEVSGGDVLQLRLVIENLIDNRRALKRDCRNREITDEDIDRTASQIESRLSVFSAAFFRPFARVASSRNGLGMLEQLFEREECAIREDTTESFGARRTHIPTEIELCGIARRKSKLLIWASPLMKVIAKQYFSAWTLGDCWACLGDWQSADVRYQAAIKRSLPVALTANHRPHLANAIGTFAIELVRRATDASQSLEKMQTFFCDNFVALTGVDNLSFWRFADNEQCWRSVPVSSQIGYSELTEVEASRITRVLRSPESMEVGHCEFPNFERLFGTSFRLPNRSDGAAECIVASNFRSDTAITAVQRENFRFLCEQFSIALRHRLEFEKQHRQAEVDRRLLSALPSLLQIVSRNNPRSEVALRSTADNLRSNDLRRVMFSLVDEISGKIQGVVDSRADGQPDIAELTTYSLSVPRCEDGSPKYEDIQQKCVLEQLTLLISNADAEPLVNKNVKEVAGLEAFVLFPIKKGNRVLGTMHIERLDRTLPSPEYISAMEEFCDNLGRILYTMSWHDGLEQVATAEPDSVTLLDVDLNLQFANFQASKHYQVKSGWQSRPIPMREKLPADTVELIDKVRLSGVGEKRMFPELAVIQEVSPIRDWRNLVYGVSIRTQDVSSQKQLMEAFREFSQCRNIPELAEAILKRMRESGHSWTRVYQALNDEQLLGVAQYGFAIDSAGANAFKSNRVILDRRTNRQAFWQSLERKQTTVYSYDLNREFDQAYITETGLRVTNVRDTADPAFLAKNPGDVWIDLPLYCDRRSSFFLGKITVDCRAGLTPQELLDLEILSVAASEAWAVILDRQDREVELQAERRQEMLHAMGETMHQLQSRIASLWTWKDNIQQGVTAEALVVSLTTRLQYIDETIANAKKKLRPLRAKPVHVDIHDLVSSELLKLLRSDHFRICIAATRLTAEIDAELFMEVIDELVLNGRKALRASDKSLQIRVIIEPFERLGNPWCRIVFINNGPPIDPNQLELIFGAFYTHWPSDCGDGSGLGLPHLRSILAVHRGQIFAKQCDEGACFVIEFPRNLIQRFPRSYPVEDYQLIEGGQWTV